MKIALNMRQGEDLSQDGDREKSIERDIAAAKRGDWEAKTRLARTFMPLFTSLARKRAHETAAINRHIEAGRDGLLNAVRSYKPNAGMKFEVFALSYIEDEMDRASKPGFFARLFGHR